MGQGKKTTNKKIKISRLSFCSRRSLLKGLGMVFFSSLGGPLTSIGSRVLANVHVPKEIHIGTFGPSHCATPFVYAKLQDYFKQEGLKVNLINYPKMVSIAQDLIDGKLDFGQLIVPLALAIHAGTTPFAKAVPLVIPQIAGTNGAALMVKGNLDIKSPLNFKGKTMANHSILSVHYLINMMFLEKHGLDHLKDINFQILKLDEAVGAMEQGTIDTFVMPEPINAIAEHEGTGKVYMFSRYIWQNHPCCALVTTRNNFEKNKDIVTSVTRAITRAGLLANNPDTREETIDLLQSVKEYKYSEVPKEVLLSAFIPGRSDFYPFPFQSSAILIAEQMKKYGLLPDKVDERAMAKEVFLSDFSKSIMKSLGAEPPESVFRVEKILGELKDYSYSPPWPQGAC